MVSVATAALMTGADLGATTKPWEFQKETAGLIAEEFWSQGDMERQHLLAEPSPMMNREMRHQLPRLQVVKSSKQSKHFHHAFTSGWVL